MNLFKKQILNAVVIVAAVGAAISFSSCFNTFSVDGYKIEGEIKGYINQPIYLDELMYGNSTTVDTALTDKNGEYEMKGHVKEKGIYRLRLADGDNYFLILDNDQKIIINADKSSAGNYDISGAIEAVQFKRFTDSITVHNKIVSAAEQHYLDLQRAYKSDSELVAYRNQADLLATRYLSFVKNYIDTSKNYLLCVFAASLLNPNQDLPTLKKLGERLTKNFAESKYTKQYLQNMTPFVESLIGKHFKEINLPNLESKYIKLSSIKGKYILLDFWASWCGPCRKENPNVVAAYNKYKDTNFTVFSVSLDEDAGKWYDAVKADKLTWEYHVSELKGWESEVCKDYYIQQIPSNFLIDTAGIIIAQDLRGEDLDKKLDEVLAKKSL